MKETLLEALIEIFDHLLEGESLAIYNTGTLIEQLEKAGVSIQRAKHNVPLTDKQVKVIQNHYLRFNQIKTPRILSEVEYEKIGTAGWEYLLQLEKDGIITNWIRELILNEVIALDQAEISLPILKNIVLRIVQKVITQTPDMSLLEQLLFYTDAQSKLH